MWPLLLTSYSCSVFYSLSLYISAEENFTSRKTVRSNLQSKTFYNFSKNGWKKIVTSSLIVVLFFLHRTKTPNFRSKYWKLCKNVHWCGRMNLILQSWIFLNQIRNVQSDSSFQTIIRSRFPIILPFADRVRLYCIFQPKNRHFKIEWILQFSIFLDQILQSKWFTYCFPAFWLYGCIRISKLKTASRRWNLKRSYQRVLRYNYRVKFPFQRAIARGLENSDKVRMVRI